MPDNPYILPPLRQREPVRPKGRMEARLDAFMTRAVLSKRSWWASTGSWLLRNLVVRPTLHFGRTFPYLLRPWYGLSWLMRQRLAKVRFETVRTIFFRRLFGIRWQEGKFRPSYALLNWLALYLALNFAAIMIEGAVVYGTYMFGTYSNVVVTEAYRNITDESTYAIHGYRVVDGKHEELYFELGPNWWFLELTPEYKFGQIPKLGLCTFDTYWFFLRIPKTFRIFSKGSLYAANPWVVSAHCITPDIVPPAEH